jgi:hypothetical protein
MEPGPTDHAGDGVIERLQAEGYSVVAPQFPESSLADDVARLRQVLNRQRVSYDRRRLGTGRCHIRTSLRS